MDITEQCRSNRSCCDCWPNMTSAAEYNESHDVQPPLPYVIYEFRYSLSVTIFFCVAYTLVFAIGVVGNCFVVGVVYCSPRMRSPTNLFIANLACADLLVNVLCLPFTLVGNIMSAWIMGWVICKTVPYLQGVSVSASINTLVAISVERCLAICYPLKWQMTSRACRLVLLIIWAFSLIITLPWAIFFRLHPLEDGSDIQICTELWPTPESGNIYFVVAHLVMCYLFPLTLISVCYLLIWRRVCRRTLPGEPHSRGGVVDLMIHRSKVKVIKMLLVVVVSFALSWLPLYVLFTMVKFGGHPSSETEEAIIHALLPIAQWLGASNSCVNPILYAFFNRKFRTGFKAIITSRSCCKHLRYNNELSASVKSNFSCRMNAKNGSVLMTRMPITQSKIGKGKGHTSATTVYRHNSASAATTMRTDKNSGSFNNNYTKSCRTSSSVVNNSHHVIMSSSLSALSHMNATSV
ncbi:neuropeptide SIFamide receptor isoform X2 [Cryptotermes secundus]|uniref:neuropeptide SIFamide receptor isoform X2 n=1 Tax=Cryptotermes secundus TaxID=105785 RepID=UPI000CD7BF47|nr:neuropeptide SIFamide receptor isoform X2 [Cryptotermes secundus]